LSVVSKMISFKLIVPDCVHYVNIASGISPFRVSTSRLVSQKYVSLIQTYRALIES
jgi:hypothetical protein